MISKGINMKLTNNGKVCGLVQCWIELINGVKTLRVGWSSVRNAKFYDQQKCEREALKRSMDNIFIPFALENAFRNFIQRCMMYYKQDVVYPDWVTKYSFVCSQ